MAQCGPCHGVDGRGGRGANLAVPKLKRAADNAALFKIVQFGIEGTSMDGAWQLSDGEIWRVVAVVRSLGQSAKLKLPGDPARGQSLYQTQGCAGCHIVSGQGSSLGPELTIIGAQRSPSYLRESLISPSAAVPQDFAMVRVRTRGGRQIEGIRLNEDSFTLQLKDLDNRIFSFRKDELAEWELYPQKSPMPACERLQPSELDDLVAYLAGLRGEP